MSLYFIQYRVDFPFTMPSRPGWSELQSSSLTTDYPIEYASDITDIEVGLERTLYSDWVVRDARFIGGNLPPRLKVTLLDWRVLKGEHRP